MYNKVIYVAGPFRGKNHFEIHQNICAAERLALLVWQYGAVALCPHLNTAHFQGALPDEAWLDGDLELLKRCDAVLVVPFWQDSKGTCREIEFAKQHNIPVFYALTELADWMSDSEYQALIDESRKRTGPMPWLDTDGKPLC